MKYYVMKSANGNVSIESEWSDINSAKVAYHDVCKAYWNAPDVIIGYVAILSSNFEIAEGYIECITHPAEEA